MIYLNNAATAYPKFPETLTAINDALKYGLLYCNRDAIEYTSIQKAIFQLRENIIDIANGNKLYNYNVVLNTNDTICLNDIIFGQEYNDESIIITTSMEHNSIARPLYQLEKQNKNVKILYLNSVSGILDYNLLNNILNKYGNKIKYLILSHASNITGDVLDIEKIGNILKEYNIPFVVDAAQTFGIVPIDLEKSNIAVLTFSGHKGLNGPQGTGGMCVRSDFKLNPILFGGTGNSSSLINPNIVFPDSFEIGTPAVHDILGLAASINVIKNKIGINKYSEIIINKANYLLNELKKVPNIIIYGNSQHKQLPIISFNIKNIPCKQVGQYLAKYNIVSRTGYHCSSLGIKSLNVEDEFGGTVRLSCGYYTTLQEILFTVKQLKRISNESK